MEYRKRFDPTMDPSLQVTSLQSSQRTGTLSTVHLHQGTPGAMDRQNLQSRLLKDCLPMPSALDRIHISPLLAYWSTPVDSHLQSPAEMLYQRALCTTEPQTIRHKDPNAAAECEMLEERTTQSAANHDHTGCRRKAPLYAGQSVSVINNDRTLWLPVTVVHAADHGSYIIRVIGGAEYRRA